MNKVGRGNNSMEKVNFSFISSNQETKMHAVKWIPNDNRPKAILQIVHGMKEFIERYDDFATFMAANNILVVGNDLLGHGESVADKSDWGYFGKKGHQVLVEDVEQLHQIIKAEYPKLPYFILGHSMGSFIIRNYLMNNANHISGAIIVGTGNMPLAVLNGAQLLAKIMAIRKGWRYRSSFMNELAFMGYNAHIKEAKTGYEWLSKDEEIVDAYYHDERCTSIFTLDGFYTLFQLIKDLKRLKKGHKISAEFPIFLCSGKDDPVGMYGKEVIHTEQQYKSVGLTNVSCQLYENDRHEILNETDKDLIYKDIFEWIKNQLV